MDQDQVIFEKSNVFISIAALVAGIVLSVISGFFSVIGLATLFSGAYNSVLVMGAALEFSKIICASWIYRNWKIAPIFMRIYMVLASLILVAITSMGTFGYLSKSYLEKAENVSNHSIEIDSIQAEKDLKISEIATRMKIIGQMDASVEKLISFDRIRGPDGAIAAREAQKEERALISQELTALNAELLVLSKKESGVLTEKNSSEAELGPLKYFAEFLYGEEAKAHFDDSVRTIILTIVFVFDPLAICLILAGNLGINKRNIIVREGKEFMDMDNVHTIEIKDTDVVLTKPVQ